MREKTEPRPAGSATTNAELAGLVISLPTGRGSATPSKGSTCMSCTVVHLPETRNVFLSLPHRRVQLRRQLRVLEVQIVALHWNNHFNRVGRGREVLREG